MNDLRRRFRRKQKLSNETRAILKMGSWSQQIRSTGSIQIGSMKLAWDAPTEDLSVVFYELGTEQPIR